MIEAIKTAFELSKYEISIEDLQKITYLLYKFCLKLQGKSNTIQEIKRFLSEIESLYQTTLSFDVEKMNEVVGSVQHLAVRLNDLIRQINESPNLTDIENLSDSLKQIYDEFQTLKTAFEFLKLNEHISVIQNLYGMISQFIVYLKTIPNDDLHFYFVLKLLLSFQTIPSFSQNVFSTLSGVSKLYDFSILGKKIEMTMFTLNQEFTKLEKSITFDTKAHNHCVSTLNGINLELKLSNTIDMLKFVESMVSRNTLSDIFQFIDSVNCASKIYQMIMSFQFPSDFFKKFFSDIDGMKYKPVGLDRMIFTILYKVISKITVFLSNLSDLDKTKNVPPKMVKFLTNRLSFLLWLISGNEEYQKGQKRMRSSEKDDDKSSFKKEVFE